MQIGDLEMAKELTEADKYFIKMFAKKMSVKELAEKLGDGIGPKTVEKYLGELKEKNPNFGMSVDELLGRQKTPDGKPIRGEGASVVMTEAASQVADEDRETTDGPVGRNKAAIHRPRD